MKASLLPALAVLATVAVAGQAHAQRLSSLNAQHLAALCTGDRTSSEGCEAYIDGVADTAGSYQELRPEDGSKGAALPGYVCVPRQVTGIQLRETFVEWLRANPNENDRQAAGAVLRALDARFRCPGQPNR